MPTYHLTDAAGITLLRFSYDGSAREALAELLRRIEHCDLMLGNTRVAKLQVEVGVALEPWARSDG
ncbi:hypothetical protein [Thiohalocapsa sp.]|jgi:hypothetical protein|uniref:hypothetical protein n=1 Tax=Thiohalocapsa sp. TaxID=2497641 RepID=UPI0025E29237|nr:hypothetical protein [Thiohalocapsa sp.]